MRLNPRLYHPDGTPRTTARSTNGRELNWFETHVQIDNPNTEEA